MIVCIDIGNTRSKLGAYDQGELLKTATAADKIQWSDVEGLANSPVECVVLSSVHRTDRVALDELQQQTAVFEVRHDTPLPIRLDYETPETLGIDRICAGAALATRFPGKASLSIDAGTCITYDLVDAQAIYRGGIISPGIQMRLNAMHQGTARLPQLEFTSEFSFPGKSTAACMQLGAGLAAASEMNQIIADCRKKYPQLQVVLTGGMQSFFEQHVENAIFAAPNLVLDGLNAIWQYNKNR